MLLRLRLAGQSYFSQKSFKKEQPCNSPCLTESILFGKRNLVTFSKSRRKTDLTTFGKGYQIAFVD